jgi:hypothetical protein
MTDYTWTTTQLPTYTGDGCAYLDLEDQPATGHLIEGDVIVDALGDVWEVVVCVPAAGPPTRAWVEPTR